MNITIAPVPSQKKGYEPDGSWWPLRLWTGPTGGYGSIAMKIPYVYGEWTSILTQLFWCELQGYYWFWHTALFIWGFPFTSRYPLIFDVREAYSCGASCKDCVAQNLRTVPWRNELTGDHSCWKWPVYTWWLIPLSKWVITPVINGISGVNPLIVGVITHLLSGMSHQVLDLPTW